MSLIKICTSISVHQDPYIPQETANLDGETNLKSKNNFPETAGLRTADEIGSLSQK